jgi:hypothetical protein
VRFAQFTCDHWADLTAMQDEARKG